MKSKSLEPKEPFFLNGKMLCPVFDLWVIMFGIAVLFSCTFLKMIIMDGLPS